MRHFEYYILNVFSDQGIDGGNQLGVIPEAKGLSDNEMQMISKEFNFSESTFVSKTGDDTADVRIFTPGKEIEYAGHPTIGTLYMLETLYREGNVARKHLTLNLKGGTVQGSFENDKGEVGVVSFIQQPGRFIEYYTNRIRLLKLLNLEESALADDKPFNIVAVTTMQFLFVQVKDSETLSKMKPDQNRLTQDEFLENDLCVYAFTLDAKDGGTIRARFFVPLYGIPEDPATGGIQSSFGLCLQMLGILRDNSVNEVIVEQGYEIGRPSKIYNKFQVINGELIKSETGGRCYQFAKGQLAL